MKTVKRKPKGKDVLAELSKLAFGQVNDAVKLAFSEEEGQSGVDGLDLSLISEVKRGANGGIEVKLINRLAALELLAKLLGMGQEEKADTGTAAALFSAMEDAAEKAGSASHGD